MMESNTLKTKTLTGNYFFKPTWFGMILYVEVEYQYEDSSTVTQFRKATLEEVFALKFIKSSMLT